MMRARARGGPIAGAIFGLLLAAAVVPIANVETWFELAGPLKLGDVARVTVRRPAGLPHGPEGGKVLIRRGDVVTPDYDVAIAMAPPMHPPIARIVGLGFSVFLVGFLLCAYLRTTQRGRLLRVQLTLLGLLVLFAAAGKAGLLLTSLSWLLAPTAAGALLASVIVDRYAGFGVAVAPRLIRAALPPFHGVVAILLSAPRIAACRSV